MKNYFLSIFIFFLIGTGQSCKSPYQQDNNLSTEEAMVFSMLIDELAMAFPLPPMPSKDNMQEEFSEINWDSVRTVQTKLVVDTVMFHKTAELQLSGNYQVFEDLLDSAKSLQDKTIDYSLIESKEGHELIFGNSLNDFEGKYPQLIFMSRIAFDETYNKALVFAGLSTSKTAGFLNLYLLEKIQGVWEIIYKRNIEVS